MFLRMNGWPRESNIEGTTRCGQIARNRLRVALDVSRGSGEFLRLAQNLVEASSEVATLEATTILKQPEHSDVLHVQPLGSQRSTDHPRI
jgi:hypothetical protein